MAVSTKTIRLNTDTGFLKLLAILSMLIDHIGAALLPGQAWMRIVGRVAFPLFAYCIAVGACYTRSMPRYLFRLLIMALISQPLYVLALHHVSPVMHALDFAAQPIQSALLWFWYSLRSANIMFALLLGLLMIWSIQEKKYIFTGIMVLAVWYLNPYLGNSYGWRGITLMVIFYSFLDRPLTAFAWAVGFMLWWGVTGGGAYQLFGLRFSVQTFALISIPLIYIPMNTNIRINKWVFYLFYPAHLLVLYLIDYLPMG